MSGGPSFTEAEDRQIRVLYNTLSSSEIAQLLGRPPSSIRARAQRLGFTEKRRLTHVGRRRAKPLPPAPAPKPAFVSEAEAKLAQFDPVIARCVRERRLGLAPGKLISMNIAGYV